MQNCSRRIIRSRELSSSILSSSHAFAATKQPTISHPTLFQRQITRNYWYIPLSWEELKLRLRKERDKRVIQVKLLQDRWKTQRFDERLQRASKRLRKRALRKERLRQFRLSLKEQSQVLSNNIKTMWQKSATKQRYDRHKQLHPKLYKFTKQITLTEYNQVDWFDEVGRPLTSRDSTGRFVNPWKSQSTGGVYPLMTILKWRWRRFTREYYQVGWQCVLPASLRTRDLPSDQLEAVQLIQAQAKKSNQQSPLTFASSTGGVPENQLIMTWLGHSTCLLQQGKTTILTDPMFSHKASPSQLMPGLGVGRIVDPACHIDDLPEIIDICLISHDHYDHMDRLSILQLKNRVHKWVVPLGVGAWLQDHCLIPSAQIVELEWWESVRWKRQPKTSGGKALYKPVEFVSLQDCPLTHPARIMEQQQEERLQLEKERQKDTVSSNNSSSQSAATSHMTSSGSLSSIQLNDSLWIACCPAQHWCSRHLLDRNLRLWCGYYLVFPNQLTFYFAGDTALPHDFPLFEQLGDYIHKPIDLAAIPIGAYEPAFFMQDAHVNPQEAVTIHEQLHCEKSIGIHWGSFPLSEEAMDEPPKLLKEAAEKADVDFTTIALGSSVVVEADESDDEDDDDDDELRAAGQWIVD